MTGELKPPLDLHDFRIRAERIRVARAEAGKEVTEEGIKEAEAEHMYRKLKAQALSHYRTKEEMGVTEAEIMAEGHERVVDAKRDRNLAQLLRRSAEERCAELDRNASMLNREAQRSRGIE